MISIIIFTALIVLNLAVSLPSSGQLAALLYEHLPHAEPLIFLVWRIVCVTSIIVLLWELVRTKKRWTSHSENTTTQSDRFWVLITHPMSTCILYICFICLVFYMLSPLKLDQLIYHGDFPYQYYVSMRNAANLKAGVLFGWEHNFLGGYPSFLDFSKDLSFLMLPLMLVFDGPVAFHLLVYLALFCLPWAFLIWVTAYNQNRRCAWLFTSIFLIFLQMNLRSYLNGMVTALYGQLFFFICTATFKLASTQKKKSWLLVTLLGAVLAMHIHTSFFLFTMLFMAGDFLISLSYDPLKKRRFLLFPIIGLAITPYLIMHWQLHNLAITSSKIAEEGVMFSLKQFSMMLVQPYFWSEWGTHGLLLLFLIPLTFSRDYSQALKFWLGMAWFFFMMLPFKTTEIIGFAISRSDYVTGTLACVLIGYFIKQSRFVKLWLVALVTLLFMFLAYLPFPQRITQRPISSFQPLIELIQDSGPGRVLAENAARWNASSTDQRSEQATLPHYLGYLQLLTGREFLSNPGADAYHYSRFRFNTITSGTFYGKPITQFTDTDMYNHCQKWNVATIVTWSQCATHFFIEHPRHFEKKGEYQNLTVFRVQDRDQTRDLQVLGSGNATLTRYGPLFLDITLNRVTGDSKIVLDQNFCPYWRLASKQMQLDPIEMNGQLAFKAPMPGTYSIRMNYPNQVALFLSFFLGACLAVLILVF
ncbi:hypothetical protein JXQ70_13540 [bacterium]|nr:hypothetical protein [bacterium]